MTNILETFPGGGEGTTEIVYIIICINEWVRVSTEL